MKCEQVFGVVFSFSLLVSQGCGTRESSERPEMGGKGLVMEFERIEGVEALVDLWGGRVEGERMVWPMGYEDVGIMDGYRSEDGWCHTRIDTTLRWDDKHLVVFRTDVFEHGEPIDCHMCSPSLGMALFQEREGGYALLRFRKHVLHGSGWGQRGEMNIDTLLGPVVRVDGGYATGGHVMSYAHYYDAEELEFFFGLATLQSNAGNYSKEDAGFEEINKRIVRRTSTEFVVETEVLRNKGKGLESMKFQERVTQNATEGEKGLKVERDLGS